MGWGGLVEGSALRPKLNPSNPEGFYYYRELLEHFSSGEVRLREARREEGLEIYIYIYILA